MTSIIGITSPSIHSFSLQSGFCHPDSKKLFSQVHQQPPLVNSGPIILPHFSVVFCVVSTLFFGNTLPLLGSEFWVLLLPTDCSSICFPGFCCLYGPWLEFLKACSGHSSISFYHLCTHTPPQGLSHSQVFMY